VKTGLDFDLKMITGRKKEGALGAPLETMGRREGDRGVCY
jgi:hypothetical protein